MPGPMPGAAVFYCIGMPVVACAEVIEPGGADALS